MVRAADSAVEKLLLVGADLLALFLAANLAFDVRYYIDWPGMFPGLVKPGPAPWGALYQAMPYMLFAWFVIFAVFGLYQSGLDHQRELVLLLKAWLTAFVVLFALAFFYRGFSYSRLAALFMMPLALVLEIVFRRVARLLKRYLLRLGVVREKVLVVGYTEETGQLLERLSNNDNQFELAGLLCDSQPEAGLPVLGTPADLGKVLTRQEGIDRVLLVSGALDRKQLVESVMRCQRHRVRWQVVPDLYDMLLDNLHVESVAGVPVLGPAGTNLVGLNLALKRVFDVTVSFVLLVVLSPLMLLIALLVKATSRGPVFFVQKRVGRGGRIFKMLKFRTMYTGSSEKIHRKAMEQVIANGKPVDSDGKEVFKPVRDPRVTPVGRVLRRFSFDELPQLINVLKGDMSLVGPRPAIPYEVELYNERHRRRLEALPGITGLWQVSGRNRLSFEQMVDLDLQYLRNWSPSLDLRILAKTLVAVLVHRGY